MVMEYFLQMGKMTFSGLYQRLCSGYPEVGEWCRMTLASLSQPPHEPVPPGKAIYIIVYLLLPQQRPLCIWL